MSHVLLIRNQPCNNDKIAKLKSATDLISFNAASEHFSALCNTLAYFRDDVSCGRNNLITFKSNVFGNFGLIFSWKVQFEKSRTSIRTFRPYTLFWTV